MTARRRFVGGCCLRRLGNNQTRVTTYLELPGMDESMDKSFLNGRLERSGRIRKQLIESEIPE